MPRTAKRQADFAGHDSAIRVAQREKHHHLGQGTHLADTDVTTMAIVLYNAAR